MFQKRNISETSAYIGDLVRQNGSDQVGMIIFFGGEVFGSITGVRYGEDRIIAVKTSSLFLVKKGSGWAGQE